MIEVLLEAERAMSFGLLDQAERLYRQAAEADPRNSIAVVGLARVAIERGNEIAAYGLGMAALEIDPDNQAARRLVDRLAEVMTERGDAVPDAPIERGDTVPDARIEQGARAAGPPPPGPERAAPAPAAGAPVGPAGAPLDPAGAPVEPVGAPIQMAPPARPAPPPRPPKLGPTPITRRRLKRTGLLGRLFGRRP